MQGRIGQLCSSLPIVTRLILGTCFLVYFYTPLLYEAPSMEYAFCPYYVVFRGEYYRLFTGAYLHGGILHIAMNMLTLGSIGIQIEQTIGSLPFLGLTLLFSVLTSGLITIVGYFLLRIMGNMYLLAGCSVGFSGVLFSYLIIHTHVTGTQSYNLCGMNIPAWIYPWVLLIGISVLIPQASFTGHLSGLLLGLLYCRGFLNCFFPSRTLIRQFENWEGFHWMSNSLIYSKCPVDPPIPATDRWGNWSCESCSRTWTSVGNFLVSCSDSCSQCYQGILSSASQGFLRGQRRYEQLPGEEADIEVQADEYKVTSPPSFAMEMKGVESNGASTNSEYPGEGYTLGTRSNTTPSQHGSSGRAAKSERKKNSKKPARPTPSGKSRLLDQLPRKSNRT